MTDPGETIHGDTWAFDFRLLEPRPESPATLLVLLHGVGGDETQLAGLGARVGGEVLVALPRGQRSISGDRIGWHREGLGGDGPQAVADEAEEARAKLVDFIAHLQDRHGITPSSTFVAGFSQGGGLAASAALTAPERVAGFAVLCGRILPEIEPLLPRRAALAHLRALLVHGRDDDTLPASLAEEADERLTALGVRHELHVQPGVHALTPEMEAVFVRWFRDVAGETAAQAEGATEGGQTVDTPRRDRR